MRLYLRLYFFSMIVLLGCISVACSQVKPELDEEITNDSGGLPGKESTRDASPDEGAVEKNRSWEIHHYETNQKIPSTAAIPQVSPDAEIIVTRRTKNNFESKHFTGPKVCSSCHDNLKDKVGEDVSIIKSWSSTMMANATRDPFWQAKVESEIKRTPNLRAVIAEKCTRCHAPMAHVEASKAGHSIEMFGKGILNPTNPYHALAMDGVSCTLCHQVKDTPKLGTLAGASGQFEIKSFASQNLRLLFGPYMDPLIEPMQSNAGYKPTGSKHISESKLCATCHMLKTPFVDAKGKVVPTSVNDYFPEQMAYEEWKQSSYFKNKLWQQSCQSCHMPPSKDVALSYGPPWITKRAHFGKHTFVGGNRFMLQMMKDNRQLLGITANNFDFTISKTMKKLTTSARLAVTEKSFSRGRLLFRVKIYNLAGHKLPTGYPSRRVFLHVVVKNSQQKIVFESGKSLASGYIVGVDADLNATKYEPHHNTITRPDQVQVYESIMANTEGTVTYTLLRAARYIKDNRILPHGLNKETATKDIKVQGAAAQDPDFIGGSDIVTYDIKGLPQDKYQVDIALKYQSISYRMALDLFRDKEGPYVKRFLSLYNKSSIFIDTITSTSFK